MNTSGISRRRWLQLASASLVAAGMVLGSPAMAANADWPTKTVKLVMPFPLPAEAPIC